MYTDELKPGDTIILNSNTPDNLSCNYCRAYKDKVLKIDIYNNMIYVLCTGCYRDGTAPIYPYRRYIKRVNSFNLTIKESIFQ